VASPFASLALKSSLRPSQIDALDAFEADRAAGRTSTHLVAPPGSGKTVVGLEIVRRLGRPALVLAPTATIQAAACSGTEGDGDPSPGGASIARPRRDGLLREDLGGHHVELSAVGLLPAVS